MSDFFLSLISHLDAIEIYSDKSAFVNALKCVQLFLRKNAYIVRQNKKTSLVTTERNTLRKIVFNLRGDNGQVSAITKTSITGGGGTLNDETQQQGAYPNWQRAFFNSTTRNTTHALFNFTLEREQVIKPQEGTETGNGFGGVYQDDAVMTAEASFNTVVPSALVTNYENGDKIYVSAYNKDAQLGFFATGCGITRYNAGAIDEGQFRPMIMLNCKEEEGGIIRVTI